ncbi:MAG: PAS domain-containing protein [Candidatus Thiodiazotropha sp. (ex Lucinoma borealis)]|nr:PAS domain-containing protein [Candidatus Thiodiazotropha sp. (ex Lucinoma borealis)]
MLHENSHQHLENNIRVLLVDDDPDSAEETVRLLQHMDSQQRIEYKTVELLADALTEISQSHYDLILLDTGLADMPTPSAIHSLRDAFSYAPIIATIKYDDPELAAMWVGEGADECLFMGVVNEKVLNRVVQYAIKRYHTYSKLHQQTRTHHILNTLLSLSLQEMPFEKLLKACLEVILSAPLAEMLHQGAIFVTENGGRQLKMLAHSNIDKQTIELCKRVAFGRCLCGCAAQSGQLQFADCVDYRHQNRVEGMQPHGHYNVPIISKGKVLGVLTLYLKEGHIRIQEEEEFLGGVADTLAGIIERARTSEQLAQAHEQNSRLLSSLTSILIGVDERDCISHWNEQAAQTFGILAEQVLGNPMLSCSIGWDWAQVTSHILMCQSDCKQTSRFEVRFKPENGTNRLLSVCATPFMGESGSHEGYLLIADDVTEQKQLDSEMQQMQKLQSIGQLAAGIAHEINTPIQYIGDNVRFLREAFVDIADIISDERAVVEAARIGNVSPELIAQLDDKIEEVDLEYLEEELPNTIQQTLDGVDHVATIVRAMKEFSHPGSEEKTATNINKVVESTVIVTRNVWKYHAQMKLDLDPSIPQVLCLPGPVNEVILNIIVNAAHAIADRVGDSGDMGLIQITTGCEGGWVVVRIGDSGTGIPEDAQVHVFDPFFTTKDVGQGTGQGLSLSHRIIVEQHDGELNFETEIGVGTTFIIKLPL